ncbi:MAG: sulfotransferase [Pseudomonadota bacterium]
MKRAYEQELTALMAMAARSEQAGQPAQAEAAYRKVLEKDTAFHRAWHALGLLAHHAGGTQRALHCIETAIAIDGGHMLYHRNIGEMYRRLGRLEQAIAAGRRACALAPRDLDAHYNLGLAYTDAQRHADAIAAYRAALAIDEGHGLSWNNLGSALERGGDQGGAMDAYARAVALDPRHAEAHNNLGAIHLEQGRLDQARASFEAAIAARPDLIDAHYNLSSLKTYRKDDPHLTMLERCHPGREQLASQASIRYHFALAKALDDSGADDRAFAAYAEGNRLQHSLLPVDEAKDQAMLEAIVRTFDRDFFTRRQHWRGAAEPGRTPVFIVGMPRSGTTLLEQILSSHGALHGAGELPDLHRVVTALGAGRPFPEGIAQLDEAALHGIGHDYLTRVWQLAPSSAFISDKMPANFFYLGLIHLALPHAKIIHATRDPMDSCFSCFSRLFNDTMAFAYDQGTLGRYYLRYQALMRHWDQVLPPGTILDLSYEAMVADTEGQARRLLDFVGLPWHPQCLDFHTNDRAVKTASVAQVRRPIYTSSVARWKRFARHLGPLHKIVGGQHPIGATDAAADAGAHDTAPYQAAAEAVPAGATADAHHLEGTAHYRQGRFDLAARCYQQALALRPDFAQALNSQGFLLQDQGRLDEALACFSRAVELAPQLAMARLNLGMLQLKLGMWEAGWENYEARWIGSAEASRGTFGRPPCPLPHWEGERGTGALSLLIIVEQGFGDTLQFARYLPLALERFARVGFVCSVPTQRLIEWAWGERVVTFTRLPADYCGWDRQAALLSLPRAFATRPDTIPGAPPYLRVPAPAASHWRARLAARAPGRLRIGIAWAGRKAHQSDARRSLAFTQLHPLLADTRVSWVSLQKWAPEDARPAIPDHLDWIDWTEQLSDFADTAALIMALDLVISIDSAMVHLAGALGRPVWMMNRYDSEWRWFHERADSPWYPSLRIFRQRAFGHWDSVLTEVAEAVRALPAPRAIEPAKRRAAQAPAVAATSAKAAGGMHGAAIKQALQLAQQYQAGGRLQQAAQLLRQILRTAPHHAHALHLLGVVLWSDGQTQQALQLIEQALALDNGVALFHSNVAEMYRQAGRLGAAIEHGQRAIALDPQLAAAHSNLGVAYFDAKDYARAAACQRQALLLAPTLAQAHNNLGGIARAQQDLAAAAVHYRRALESQPDYLETLSNLGAALLEDGQADAAETPLTRALQLNPHHAESLCNMGLLRLRQDRVDQAGALLARALHLRPAYLAAQLGLAGVYREQHRLAEAETLLRQCLENDPDQADTARICCRIAALHMERGESEQAEAAYRRALAAQPDLADALAGIGHLRMEQGKLDQARQLLEQAIGIDHGHLGARLHLIQASKVKPGDANLAALEAKLREADHLSTDQCVSLHYALGKAYDDTRQWERAFPHFLEGARLKRATLRYDGEADAARVRRLIALADRPYLDALRGGGDPSTVPVFVLGMPRSGTTLTEQIIASHPQVHGAGELNDLMALLNGPTPGQAATPPFPEQLVSLTPRRATLLGQQYVARLRARAPQAARISDKMPANYLALGLIPLLLPQARIIHVRRNPIDTCVSCFTRLFNRHQDATYDLHELGRHYAQYARLMAHWRGVMPAHAFMEVQYEDIVADMAGQARRLIEWIGLEWDDACLDFHTNARPVRTSSLTQVRQPIYTSSVERWRHYEKFLSPLLDGLGPYAYQEDRWLA